MKGKRLREKTYYYSSWAGSEYYNLEILRTGNRGQYVVNQRPTPQHWGKSQFYVSDRYGFVAAGEGVMGIIRGQEWGIYTFPKSL